MQKEILKKIKSGELKMKPRWKFEVEKKSLWTLWIFSTVIVAMAMIAISKFVEVYEPFEVLKLGEVGQQLLLEDIPYMWIAVGSILILIGLKIDSRIGDNYKKSTAKLLMTTTGIAILLAILFRFLAG